MYKIISDPKMASKSTPGSMEELPRTASVVLPQAQVVTPVVPLVALRQTSVPHPDFRPSLVAVAR